MTRTQRPQGEITRGTTAPNRLRRIDRWIAATQRQALRAVPGPLAVDLGYGASPITTVELYERLRAVSPDLDVTGIEIDPDRVARGVAHLAAHPRPGLTFRRGGFELPVDRPPVLIRALNVLRQYDEPAAWRAWDGLRARLHPAGVLVEGTCDEIGRRATWTTLGPEGPRTLTLAAHLPTLERPSDLAERLPKTLIHRNVPGERIHAFLTAFDHAWATTSPYSAFGPRSHWIAAVRLLATTHPVHTHPPHGAHPRWRLGEITVPWPTVAPR
ncbi:SAM-dependent methyltransferase [Actinomadura flavalba]|uniref:SAM-dependent methyltransferase n=1 Tax=Actinomadura flavalba TaxID=1120938 RepID=UPI00036B96DB|nr:SAM-dependent methyltransferase [Actinomadura flavalba]